MRSTSCSTIRIACGRCCVRAFSPSRRGRALFCMERKAAWSNKCLTRRKTICGMGTFRAMGRGGRSREKIGACSRFRRATSLSSPRKECASRQTGSGGQPVCREAHSFRGLRLPRLLRECTRPPARESAPRGHAGLGDKRDASARNGAAEQREGVDDLLVTEELSPVCLALDVGACLRQAG